MKWLSDAAAAFSIVGYIKNRLSERSTWAAISLGVVGAAALMAPWSYVAMGVAVIGALTPTSKSDSGTTQ